MLINRFITSRKGVFLATMTMTMTMTVCSLFSLMLLSGCGGGSGNSNQRTPSQLATYRITRSDGTEEILSVDENSTFFVVSPDGNKVAFSMPDVVNAPLYVANRDRSAVKKISSNKEGSDNGFVWSSDSKKIAFYSTREGHTYRALYVINTDGTNETKLTDGADYPKDIFRTDGDTYTRLLILYVRAQ
jgi:Tol biopolymer transport system component